MFKPSFTLATLALSAIFCVALSAKVPSVGTVTKILKAVERHSSVNDCHHHSYHCFWGWPHDWVNGCRNCVHHCASITSDVSGVTADAMGIQHSECCEAHLNDGGDRKKIESGKCLNSHNWMAANKIRQLDSSSTANLQAVSMRPHTRFTHGNNQAQNLYCDFGAVIRSLLQFMDIQRERQRDWALPRALGGRQGPPPAPAAGFVQGVRERLPAYNRIERSITDQLDNNNNGWNVDQTTAVWYWHLRIGTVEGILANANLDDTQKMQQILSTFTDN